MARYFFGVKLADWTFDRGAEVTVGELTGNNAVVIGGVEVTFWNAEVGGTQYIDLIDAAGTATTSVRSSDGSDGRSPGTIPLFEGPDEIAAMWASAGGGPRQLVEGHTAQALLAVIQQAAQTAADLEAHRAASNPHAMASSNLTDFSDATPEDGQLPVYDTETGTYQPTTVAGINPDDFVETVGGSEIVIPIGDTTTRALGIRLPPGDRSAAANTYEVVWNAGTEAAPNWVLVTRLDAYGQLRGRPSRSDRVYGQVAQVAGQTADLFQFTDPAGNPLAWVDFAARVRAPNLGITVGPWYQETGTAGTGQYRFYNPTGTALILRGFIVSAGGVAPAGGDFIINPKVDGAAVYSTANRPKIVAGQRSSGLVTALTTTVWPAGSYITVDVDSVPSTPPTKVTIQALAY